ncbi:hypothetical protein CBOM_04977 [Ceraceosorus bombacis]|uniref:Uncharacterized protein n=1 Tax=Ceraceosorus bombacis TaxID=401625 RepID=A0A0P1BIR3_9BASI|nr:hypothetical protein CBOM_04977 [Ceraceosorus bombacis]
MLSLAANLSKLGSYDDSEEHGLERREENTLKRPWTFAEMWKPRKLSLEAREIKKGSNRHRHDHVGLKESGDAA